MYTRLKNLLAVDILNTQSIPQDVDLLFFEDHVGNDDYATESWQHLNKLIATHPEIIFFIEYFSSQDVENTSQTLCVPFQAYHSGLAISKILPNRPWCAKTSAFNFSINKMRGNRLWLLQALQKHNLVTDTYSLYQSPVTGYQNRFWTGPGTENKTGYANNNDLKNIEIYYHYLKNNVYEPSYVSLITEPGWNDHSVTMTEKTLFAFEAGTIPLWIGGYQQAKQCKALGFDVFDDLVNHSYQHLTDPMERMTVAIESNLTLLQDLDQLKKIYVNNHHRLLSNRQLLRSCNWFYSLLDRELLRVPLTNQQLKTVFQKLIIEHNCQWPSIRPHY